MTLAQWRPARETVGALLSARVGSGGITDTSTPSTGQVDDLIGLVQRDIRGGLDHDPAGVFVNPDDEDEGTWADYAKDTVALGVAAYLENGLVPEQNDDLNSGPAEYFRRRYQEHVARLTAACGDAPVA